MTERYEECADCGEKYVGEDMIRGYLEECPDCAGLFCKGSCFDRHRDRYRKPDDPRKGEEKKYVADIFRSWSHIMAGEDKAPVHLVESKCTGFIPVFDSLEDLRAEYPHADHHVIYVGKDDRASEKS